MSKDKVSPDEMKEIAVKTLISVATSSQNADSRIDAARNLLRYATSNPLAA